MINYHLLISFVFQVNGSAPIIKGERPPPLVLFTLDVLPNDRSKAILFGGYIVPEKDKYHRSADLYLLTLSSDTVVSIS